MVAVRNHLVFLGVISRSAFLWTSILPGRDESNIGDGSCFPEFTLIDKHPEHNVNKSDALSLPPFYSAKQLNAYRNAFHIFFSKNKVCIAICHFIKYVKKAQISSLNI